MLTTDFCQSRAEVLQLSSRLLRRSNRSCGCFDLGLQQLVHQAWAKLFLRCFHKRLRQGRLHVGGPAVNDEVLFFDPESEITHEQPRTAACELRNRAPLCQTRLESPRKAHP